MDIVCVLPALLEGSGGHRTILANLAAVAARGASVTVLLEEADDAFATQLAVAESLFPGAAEVFNWRHGWDEATVCGIGLATSAPSVAPLRQHVRADQYAYFVQDWESWFNPMGDGYLAAELTYLMDWRFITIGDWLRHRLLRLDGSRRIGSVPFGVDSNVAPLAGPVYRRDLPVALHWQPEKSRRCSKLAVDVLARLRRTRPDIPVVLFGSDAPVPGGDPHTAGLLSETQMLDLFRESACVVHFSSSNPSRIPFEAIACGTPTIEFFGESTCFDFPANGVHTVIPVVDELVHAVERIYDDPRHVAHAARGMSELRTRQSEMQRFADLLLNEELFDPAPAPNRAAPDIVLDPRDPATARYVGHVRRQIGAQP